MPVATYFFADLVRETSSATGVGPLTLAGALPGHRRFADTVPLGASFFYAIAGITRVAQWETGVGQIDGQGRLIRSAISASSASGAVVDFSAGLKAVALTVGAPWYGAVSQPPSLTDIAGLQSALDGKMAASALSGFGLSLASAANAAGARSQLALGTLALQNAEAVSISGGSIDATSIGAVTRAAVACTTLNLSGSMATVTGTVAAPSIAATGDANTGLFFPAADTVAVTTGGVERMRVSAAGNVGIGTASPQQKLHITGGIQADNAGIDGVKGDQIFFSAPGYPTTYRHKIQTSQSSDPTSSIMMFSLTNGASSFIDIMTLLGNGNVGIGIAAPAQRLHVVGSARFESSGQALLEFRSDTAGTVKSCEFSMDTGGNLFCRNNTSGSQYFDSYDGAITFRNVSNAFATVATISPWTISPGADNAATAGGAAQRYSTVYAVTGTINTSDAREKTWRGGLNEAERAAALEIGSELGFFQWNDAVEEKGADANTGGARLHFGVRAQAVWAIMAKHELVEPIGKEGRPGKTPYAFLCWDEWDDQMGDVMGEVEGPPDEEGNPTVVTAVTIEKIGERIAQPAGNRYGVRSDQLALFLIAALFVAVLPCTARPALPAFPVAKATRP